MNLQKSQAAKELILRRKARTSLHDFITYMDEDYIVSDFSQMTCKALDNFLIRMMNGERPILILGAPPQHGKLMADDTPVLTTRGWVNHGDLKVGDYVYGSKGKPIRVVALSEKGNADMRVELNNGNVFYCHERHEWTVYSRDKKREVTLETEAMLGHKNGYAIVGSNVGIRSIVKDPQGKIGNCIQVDAEDGLYLVGKDMILTHNSQIVSRYFPAYVFGKYPDLRIAGLSYAMDLASSMNRDVQRVIMSPEYSVLFPETRLSDKRVVTVEGQAKRNSEEFEIVGKKGAYVGQGVGGPLTGKRVDCFVAGTKVTTSRGLIDIDKLHMQPYPCKILSYDIKKKAFNYENIQAVASRKGYGIYRITTASGRVFEATGDHRVYTEKGWVEARKLTASDVLLCGVRKESDTDCSGLQKNNKNEQKLWKLLLQKMRVYSDTERQAEKVCHLPKAIPGGWAKVLFERLYACALQASPKKSNLRDVPKRFHGISYVGWISAILRKRMLGQGARKAHDGGWQPSVQGWSKPTETAAAFSQGVPAYTTEDITEGWRTVCPMPDHSEKIRGASHGRMGKQQRIIEPCEPVREAPLGSAQENGFRAVRDHAVKVERVLDEATTYDIQVSGNHNFFANGVLVHNCGIIDDPIKNAKEALSPTVKMAVWNWYVSTFLTRLSKNSGQIIMATRWATDDLSGKVLDAYERAESLVFPAISREGDALIPELHPLDKLLETKATLGDYFWSAMYQQSPKPMGGAIFKDTGVRYYLPNDLPDKFDTVIHSWDMTFKDGEGTDYVVGQVWGKKGAHSFLLHQVRKRMGFVESVAAVRQMKEDYPQARRILIEDKANGPAIIDALKGVVSGLTPIEPDGSKIARAHAMTAEWEAGDIFLPHPDVCEWTADLVGTITTFPACAFDDEVDAMTQGIRFLYKPDDKRPLPRLL